jgi:hypothetical protein
MQRSRNREGSQSSSFLNRFMGKMSKIDKSGTVAFNVRPLDDISNGKCKTSIMHSRIDRMLIESETRQKPELKVPLPKRLKPLNSSATASQYESSECRK